MRLLMRMSQEDIVELVKKAGRAGIIPVPQDHTMISFDFVADDVGEFELVIELHRLLEKPNASSNPQEDVSNSLDSMRL